VPRPRSFASGAVAVMTAMAVAGVGAYGATLLVDGGRGPATVATTTETPTTPASTPSQTITPTATPTPTETPTPTPTPTIEALLEPGDSGDRVRELQSRLKQLQWYDPNISGDYDETTREAVSGFQGKRGFEVTGVVDQETWDKLVSMSRQPTDDEMHNRIVPGPTIIGPGSTGDRVRELQARLKQIGWLSGEVTANYGSATSTAVAGFQTKRGIPSTGEVDQRTWDRLVAMTRKPSDDELHNRVPTAAPGSGAATGLDSRCLTGRVMCIDKSSRSLRWVVDGQVRMTVAVRFGSEFTPTREGAFSVYFKSRDHHSSLYDTPMPYAMFFSGGQAVHYSADFAANGYSGASHGCVNVRDKGAVAALFDSVRVGDRVVVYRS
jgi:peptidoglycan hydrolase-like protein with peptidoglycan-binding domain